MKEVEEKKHWIRRFFEGLAGLIALAVVFVSVFYGLTSWIDSRVRAVVTDDAYVRRIAAEVRPSVIFDGKGSILVDQGAMQYIDRIQIIPRGNAEGVLKNFPAKIIITPKEYLAHAPLLSCLDPTWVTFAPERGAKFDWIYPFDDRVGGWQEQPVYTFRLELLR